MVYRSKHSQIKKELRENIANHIRKNKRILDGLTTDQDDINKQLARAQIKIFTLVKQLKNLE